MTVKSRRKIKKRGRKKREAALVVILVLGSFRDASLRIISS